jgi:hypothetical protein
LDDAHVLNAERETGLRVDAAGRSNRGNEVFLDAPALFDVGRDLDFSGIFVSESASLDPIRTEVVRKHALTSEYLQPI